MFEEGESNGLHTHTHTHIQWSHWRKENLDNGSKNVKTVKEDSLPRCLSIVSLFLECYVRAIKLSGTCGPDKWSPYCGACHTSHHGSSYLSTRTCCLQLYHQDS